MRLIPGARDAIADFGRSVRGSVRLLTMKLLGAISLRKRRCSTMQASPPQCLYRRSCCGADRAGHNSPLAKLMLAWVAPEPAAPSAVAITGLRPFCSGMTAWRPLATLPPVPQVWQIMHVPVSPFS
jgi:hypothetical protein